ncbi:glutathione S-transferase family protein [Vulgatibacter sp.]|uniref:glutathione S-transferase family protein n=1 Tax=Vulgatibacter sp. TaxID=1971226 RepID=UPI0035616214
MLTLFFSPGACSLAAHILLEELGLPYEAQLVSLKDGAHKQPAYLAINPQGKVPALRFADGWILTQNPAILTHLAGLAPEAGLLPAEPRQAARALQIVASLSAEAHPAFGRVLKPAVFSADEAHAPQIREKGRADFQAKLQELDAMLSADGPWALGSSYSYADPFVHVFFRWASASQLDLASLPRMARISAAILERPAARRAMVAEGLIEA